MSVRSRDKRSELESNLEEEYNNIPPEKIQQIQNQLLI